jgi:CubicO group peptidase (beta-lactamase class C family)
METPKLRVFRQITLVDLATHTPSLPRMPDNFRPRNSENPHADYTEEQLYAFLRSYELIRDIGSKFEYSNLGFGLLGQALKRFKEQKALPGSESATRRLIGELRDKHVDYDQFTPQFASTARQAETPFAAPLQHWDHCSH